MMAKIKFQTMRWLSHGVAAMALTALLTGIADAQTAPKKLKPAKSVIIGLVTSSDEQPKPAAIKKKRRAAKAAQGTVSNITGLSAGTGIATTKTEIVAGQNVAPMLDASSSDALRAAEERYAEIVAAGGWPKVAKESLKKGAQGSNVAALNRRLYVEGYLRAEATQGEFAETFTSATEEALIRFQRNLGLLQSGKVDGPTLAALNVPAEQRLRAIRANIPRLEIYRTNLGDRYLIVNIPAAQIEAVNGGRVYSRHNAIVGKPERPTPVVMTALSQVKFNPYWNAPASIVERDIIPKIQTGGTRILEDMDITVFRGVGGPEIDTNSVDWDYAVADDFHFRQEPGPKNAMATAKIEFDSPFGIYLHDTPEKQLFKSGRRFYSSGCVRVEQVDVLLNWILRGQGGYDNSRIAGLAESLDRVDVPLAAPPQLRVAYLTAWPVGNTVAFRNDIYDLDSSGFTVGQPMPVGEVHEGLRYTLKPIPRLVAASDGDGGFFGRAFGKSAKGRDKGKAKTVFDDDDEPPASAKVSRPSVILGLSAPSRAAKPKAKVKTETKEAKAAPKEAPETRSTIIGLSTGNKAAVKAKKLVKTSGEKTVKKPRAEQKVAKKETAACKPGADGKLPAGCAPKAKPKTNKPETAAN